MLPAFIKIVKPSLLKFSGDPLKYPKFKAAFKVEVDKKELFDATEKLKFLLDAVEEVQSPVWQNSCQVLINIWRHGLRSMSVLVA